MKIEPIELKEPNKDIIRMTEMILDQNKKILEMNSRLLAFFSMPMMVVTKDNDRVSNKEKGGGYGI